MIDVIRVAAAFMQFDQGADDFDEVLRRQHRRRRIRFQDEALVDLVATHATEVVALRVEEQAHQRVLRRRRVRGIARTQQRIDLVERRHFTGGGRRPGLRDVLRLETDRIGRILRDRVLDQRRFHAARGGEHLHAYDAGGAQLLEERWLERLMRLGHHFAILGDDVHREHARLFPFAVVERVLFVAQLNAVVAGEHLDLLVARFAEAVDQLIIQLVADLDGAIGFRRFPLDARLLRFLLRLQLLGNLLATDEHQLLGDDGAGDFAEILPVLADALDVQFADAEEETVDVLIPAVAECAEQRGGRELLLLVDVDEDHVVDVHGELDPRSTERDDA